MKVFVLGRKRLVSYIALVVCGISLIFVGYIENSSVFKNESDKLLPIYSVDKGNEKVCALTFDAAWDDSDTDILINILKKHNVPATFFMVGSWVQKYPESVKKFDKNGHEIMNHSDTHPHINQLSNEKIAEEIKKCSDKIEATTGKRPTLFRGPYGEYNNAVIKEAESQNMKVLQWNIDSLDWKNLSADEICARVTSRITPGSVILLHNGAKNTPQALDNIIKTLKDKGYKFVKATDLIYKENYTIDHTGKQILN